MCFFKSKGVKETKKKLRSLQKFCSKTFFLITTCSVLLFSIYDISTGCDFVAVLAIDQLDYVRI